MNYAYGHTYQSSFYEKLQLNWHSGSTAWFFAQFLFIPIARLQKYVGKYYIVSDHYQIIKEFSGSNISNQFNNERQ